MKTQERIVRGLKTVLDLLRNEKNWSRTKTAEGRDGENIEAPATPRAVKWSLLGALALKIQDTRDNEVAVWIVSLEAEKVLPDDQAIKKIAEMDSPDRVPRNADDRRNHVRILELANSMLPHTKIVSILESAISTADENLVQMSNDEVMLARNRLRNRGRTGNRE